MQSIHNTRFNVIKPLAGVQGFQPPMLIFVQSKDRAKELFNTLAYDGVRIDVIHADKTQAQVSLVCFDVLTLCLL